MNPTLRNILAVLVGIFVGSVVNMGLIKLSPFIVPPPEGVDVTDIESVKANFHLYEAKHMIMPYLAHALGALVGGFTAVKIAASNHFKLALGIGAFFLFGGLYMMTLLPQPTWFTALDLISYLPAAYLGGKLAMKKQ